MNIWRTQARRGGTQPTGSMPSDEGMDHMRWGAAVSERGRSGTGQRRSSRVHVNVRFRAGAGPPFGPRWAVGSCPCRLSSLNVGSPRSGPASRRSGFGQISSKAVRQWSAHPGHSAALVACSEADIHHPPGRLERVEAVWKRGFHASHDAIAIEVSEVKRLSLCPG